MDQDYTKSLEEFRKDVLADNWYIRACPDCGRSVWFRRLVSTEWLLECEACNYRSFPCMTQVEAAHAHNRRYVGPPDDTTVGYGGEDDR